jgi:hypothetical protein
VSLASDSRAGFATRQRQDLIRAPADVRGAAEGIERQATTAAVFGFAPGLANAGVISGQFEGDLRVRQKT